MPRLPFVMQHQHHTKWCWAAVTVSVDDFLSAAGQTQCQLVSAFFPALGCCHTPLPRVCNRSYSVRVSLDAVGLLDAGTSQRGLAAFRVVDGEMSQGQPIVLRLRWSSGTTGHAAVISGTHVDAQGIPWFHTEDPWYGPGNWRAHQFPQRYHVPAWCFETLMTHP